MKLNDGFYGNGDGYSYQYTAEFKLTNTSPIVITLGEAKQNSANYAWDF